MLSTSTGCVVPEIKANSSLSLTNKTPLSLFRFGRERYQRINENVHFIKMRPFPENFSA